MLYHRHMQQDKLVTVHFALPEGATLTYQGAVGDSVMDVALDNNVPGIVAQCGGGCTCCTCHCWVEEVWQERVPEAHPDELELLEYAWGVDERSRLSCQLRLSDALDGLRVVVPEQQA